MLKWLLLSLICVLCFSAVAQDAPVFTPPQVMTFREAIIYGGPGIANPQIGMLYADQPVMLIERNNIGSWVRIHQFDAAGNLARGGWILSGYLQDRGALRFSEVPVNTTVADNNPDWASAFSQRELFAVPYISAISPAMVEVYRRGLEMGNQPNVITKVGDSLVASREYLTPMANPIRALNAFDYLNATVDYYGTSMVVPSAAASIGLSSFAVVDPMWADPAFGCQPGETPLACEYRVKKPVVAFIMFGPNDVRAMTDVGFGQQMRAIVQQTLDAGIIPVLSLFAIHPNDQYAPQATNFNRQLIALANEMQVPLINLWAASRILPNYGLDVDNIHLTYSGYDTLFYDAGNEAYSGVALHNLLSLRMLYAIQQAVAGIEAEAEMTPEITPALEGNT
ncbi:MAG: SH3 domain-containing protein [Anaerolineae bacterium]|nr:SH3 domain-containing protein [Anaerolineae bacterium]